jgi:hypothetical protein
MRSIVCGSLKRERIMQTQIDFSYVPMALMMLATAIVISIGGA